MSRDPAVCTGSMSVLLVMSNLCILVLGLTCMYSDIMIIHVAESGGQRCHALLSCVEARIRLDVLFPLSFSLWWLEMVLSICRCKLLGQDFVTCGFVH